MEVLSCRSCSGSSCTKDRKMTRYRMGTIMIVSPEDAVLSDELIQDLQFEDMQIHFLPNVHHFYVQFSQLQTQQ